jgi:protein-L-isoaspartate(D-aspartate) O-methyltransferase
MAYVDLITALHTSTKRDYLARVTQVDKAAAAEIAFRFGEEYWDGDRAYGYGGYRYDGRWRPVAERIVQRYDLRPGARVLDVGCGKGFLLFELTQLVPKLEVVGVDISDYALRHAKPEVASSLQLASAAALPFADASFDFVYSINTLHNLYLNDLWTALGEIQRVARGSAYITVEAYRTEREKVNLMYWQLTCRAFMTPQEWEWLFKKVGYTGDHGFIYFE